MIRRQASVLVGVLWCVALLSLVVISALHSSSLGLRVGHHHGDSIQAHYLALAGVERAKALLYHDAAQRQRSQVNHSGSLLNAPDLFRDVPLGRGSFSIVRQDNRAGAARITYGITDEESRLNLNTASAAELAKLPLMPSEVVPGILDWRDSDNQVTPNGAEIEYYASLPQPYLPRNAPFQTSRELLMVRGIPRELLLGEDVNQNGLLDPEENDGDLSLPPDNHDGSLDPGWSSWLTVHSSVENVSASGETRVNVKTADETSLTAVPGISQPIAQAIVAARGNGGFESLADLLEVRAPAPEGPGQPQPTPQRTQLPPPRVAGPSGNPSRRTNPSGPPLIDETLLKDIADFITVTDESTQRGLVNINTAAAEVLACLPGLDRESARAVVSQRESAGFFPNVAGLLDVPGITPEAFRDLAPRVTTRSETFRILSEGTVPSSGARKRIEVILHLGATGIDTLAYRENL